MKAIIKANLGAGFLELKGHFLRAIRWMEYKKVLAEPMVTHRFRLD
jgi:threonine dehydrogenase-like Zn-dependent dehydrogenase